MTVSFEETCMELDLPMDALDEAGGFVSYIARAYTGKDADLPAAIEAELSTIKSEEKRAAILKEIDDFIDEAKASDATGAVDMMGLALPGNDLWKKRTQALKGSKQFKHYLLSGGYGQIFKKINHRDGTMAKYISELGRVRAKVVSHKIGK